MRSLAESQQDGASFPDPGRGLSRCVWWGGGGPGTTRCELCAPRVTLSEAPRQRVSARGEVVTSGDVCGCHAGRGYSRRLVDRGQGGADRCPVHRTAPATEDCLAPALHSDGPRKSAPWQSAPWQSAGRVGLAHSGRPGPMARTPPVLCVLPQDTLPASVALRLLHCEPTCADSKGFL